MCLFEEEQVKSDNFGCETLDLDKLINYFDLSESRDVLVFGNYRPQNLPS